MEDLPRQPPRVALHEPQVGGELAELLVARPLPPAQPAGGVPGAVEGGHLRQLGELLRHALLGVDHGAGHLEVLVHRLAGHEEVHDLGRPLEDLVDAVVAHHPLDADRLLAAGLERGLGLVAPAAADLHRVVHDLPGAGRVPLLAGRGLQADVVAAAVGHHRRQRGDRLHGESRGRHVGDQVGHRLVLAHRPAPLHPLARPLAADLEAELGRAHRAVGDRQAAVVQGGEGDLEPLALVADQVLGRHPHVLEGDDGVGQRPQTHEVAAVLHLDAGPARLDDEGADLLRLGIAGHHHQQLGDGAVGAPELLAVEEVVPLRRPLGAGHQPRRIGADLRLGEREGRDVARGAARQVLLLQRVRAEQLERLRDADRLVSGEQRREVAVDRAQQHHHLLVLAVGEAQAAVLLGDLHAEGAQLAQAVHHVLRVFAGGVDLDGIHLVAQELPNGVVESGELGPLLLGQRIRMDQVEPEIAEEHLPQEARLLPLGLAGGFRHLPGFKLADLLQLLGHGSSPFLT